MSTSLIDLLTPGGNQESGRFFGVVVGIVTNNQDADGMHRVKVRFPWLNLDDESHWARVATPMAGNDRGLYFLPEVDDEVLVAFEHGRPEAPVVVGSLWNGKDKAPADNGDGKNNLRIIKSRAGHIVRFDDGNNKIEIVDKSGKNTIVIDSANNKVTIEADADIVITSAKGKLSLSGSSVEIKSTTGEVAVKSQAAMTVTAQADLTLKGQMVNIN